jgi:aerotaxis receptor
MQMASERYTTDRETQVPEGVFIYSRTDLKGVITEANAAFANLSGYAVEEMAGKPHNLVRHPDMPKEAFADMWRSLKANRPWQGVVKNRRKDGGYYWVLANAAPVREGGRVIGFQSLRRKPSREQIKDASEAYRKMLAGDHSVAIEDGRVVKVRSALRRKAERPDIQIGVAGVAALVAALCAIVLTTGGATSVLAHAVLLFSLGISGLAASFVLLKTLPTLARDLTQMEAYLDGMLSTGDFATSLNLEEQARSGNIARKLALMMSWVQSTIQCIQDAVIPVQDGTAQVLKSILEIDQAAESQNMATTSVAAASTELELTIREVSQHLLKTESAVAETGRRASGGADVSQRASDRIQNLASAIRGASVEVEALGASSAEVGAIAGVIREIADQTNLLALNASIEAARAGEYGRGFAVVANEVRSLADRTMKATAKIDALIGQIKTDSDRAISGMRSGSAQVEDGVALVDEAKGALTGINGLMIDAVRMVSEIANSSSQQTEAMNEISSNISHVAAMTEQNVGIVRSTSKLISTLQPMVDRVKKAVAQYVV